MKFMKKMQYHKVHYRTYECNEAKLETEKIWWDKTRKNDNKHAFKELQEETTNIILELTHINKEMK
jgi:hypothetical protein